MKKISPIAFVCLLFLKLAMPIVGLTIISTANTPLLATNSSHSNVHTSIGDDQAEPVMICHRIKAQMDLASGSSSPQKDLKYPTKTCFLCDILNSHLILAEGCNHATGLSWREVRRLIFTHTPLDMRFAYHASARGPPVLTL